VPPPPAKTSSPTPANQLALANWLTSIMAFRAESAGKPWTFYEEVDKYLGPWREKGYPIAYGKKYCQLFYNDPKLQADIAGSAWIRRTLLLLQEAIKDFILSRYRQGSLARVTEPELRKAAFDSHPAAYTEGGLTMVVMLSPGLTMHVAAIPAVEFKPTSDNFGATLVQLFTTGTMVAPRCVALILAGAAGPAHTGILGRAMAMDRARLTAEMNLGAAVADARRAVASGRCDNVTVLDRLRAAVGATEMPHPSLEMAARALINEITLRRNLVVRRYQKEVTADPSLRSIYKAFDPIGL
jgi:hypothetical protein